MAAGRRPYLTLNNRLHRHRPLRRATRRGRRLPAGLPVRNDPRRRHIGSYGSAGRTVGASIGSVSRSPTSRRLDVHGGYLASRRRRPTSSRSRRGGLPRDTRDPRHSAAARGSHPRARRLAMNPSDAWRKGFLAGIFDAEGSCSQDSCGSPTRTRRSSSGPGLPRHFGFAPSSRTRPAERAAQRPPARRYAGAAAVLPHRRPAITRKRSLEGRAIKSTPTCGWSSVEPLGVEMPMYDITTGTGDFIANGVVSHNCFARPTHEYLDFDAGRDFESRSSSRSTRPRCCGPSCAAVVGQSRSRWGRTRTRTSGSRGATG